MLHRCHLMFVRFIYASSIHMYGFCTFDVVTLKQVDISGINAQIALFRTDILFIHSHMVIGFKIHDR